MKDSRHTDTEFKTCDINLSAFLAAHNVPMSGIVKERGGQSLAFVFLHPDRCAELSAKYMFGDDRVSARALSGAAKHLRRLVKENM